MRNVLGDCFASLAISAIVGHYEGGKYLWLLAMFGSELWDIARE